MNRSSEHDEPLPSIAIIGAGPIGIEAALYARFLGYPVTVLETYCLCSSVLQWEHVTMFTPFGMNSSPLGLAAIQSHGESQGLPAEDAIHTGREWIDSYLGPLANTDLLKDCFQIGAHVTGISRDRQLVTEHVGAAERRTTPFRLLYETPEGERETHCDILIDASGNFDFPNYVGSGGAPAIGEQEIRESAEDLTELHDAIWSSWVVSPDMVSASPRNRYVVIGSGMTAATNITLLEQARSRGIPITCTWLTRQPRGKSGPLQALDDDPLPVRRQLVDHVNQLAREADWLNWRPASVIRSVEFDTHDDVYRIAVDGEPENLACDHVLANTGFNGDFALLEQLQVHRCYASGGPMNWAASLSGSDGDCLKQSSAGVDAVRTSEPDCYVIGSKSYGRDSRFLFQTGLQQIRDVFRIIGQRDTLDLYSAMKASAQTSGEA